MADNSRHGLLARLGCLRLEVRPIQRLCALGNRLVYFSRFLKALGKKEGALLFRRHWF